MSLLPTVKFVSSNITALKKALRKQYADVKSSHADEALAASFGFKSYAAMLSVLHQVSGSARVVIQSDPSLLLQRLEQFGYRGLRIGVLEKMIWNEPNLEHWRKDEVQQAINRRFVLIAANEQ